MTISNTNRTAGPFAGNGTSKNFPFSFKVFTRSDLLVVVNDPVGGERALLLDADYTVQLNPDQNSAPGGVITKASALATGATLVATSNLPILQTLDLTNNGGFYPTAINNAFDRIVIMLQQIAGTLGRTMRFPLSDGANVPELPAKNVRANKLLSFDMNGNPVAVAATSGSAIDLQLSLGGANGAGLVGSAAWYAAVVIGFNAVLVPDGASVTFAGRSTPGDGGGGTFIYSRSSVQPADGGMVFEPVGGGRLLRQGLTVFGISGGAHAAWWGVKNNGSDETAPAQACLDSCIPRGIQVNFSGHIAVRGLLIPDSTYAGTIDCSEATFDGIATTATRAVLDFVNCYGFRLIKPRVSSSNNTNYDAAIYVRAQTGTAQSTTRFCIDTPTIRNFKFALGFGSYDIKYQCSEIDVIGAQIFGCPVGVYMGGSQTGVSFIGGAIASQPNAAFAGVPERAIWMEGGFISTAATEIIKADTATGETIYLCPALNPDFSNPYPIVRIGAGQIESACTLVRIANPRGISLPRSLESSISISGGGYVSPNSAAEDFITCSDPTFEGIVHLSGPGFYCIGGSRTGWNISSASSKMRIHVDPIFFNTGFLPWLGGISGGVVLHDYQPVVSASGLAVTLPAGVSILKYVNNDTTFNFSRYGIRYNPATGLFTVPAGGFTTLDIDAGVVGGDNQIGDMYITKTSNGVSSDVRYGSYERNVGMVRAVLHNLVAGDTIGIYIRMTTGGAFDSSILQTLKICGATT